MLVLSRAVDESLTIGPDIKITIVRIAGDKVRLGIEAPAEVPILRDDLTPDARKALDERCRNEDTTR